MNYKIDLIKNQNRDLHFRVMKKIFCIVQQHKFSNSEINEMEVGFRDLYHDHLGMEKLNILWMIMPDEYAFSERKQSNASIIMIEVDEDIAKMDREKIMRSYSQFLLENFSISALDLVITVANSSFVNAFLEAQQNRVQPIYRPWIKFKQMYTALTSRFMNGYMKLRVNY